MQAYVLLLSCIVWSTVISSSNNTVGVMVGELPGLDGCHGDHRWQVTQNKRCVAVDCVTRMVPYSG